MTTGAKVVDLSLPSSFCGNCRVAMPPLIQLNQQHFCSCGYVYMVVTGADRLRWLHIGVRG